MLYLCILIYFVFFAGVAMTIAEGTWNNALTLMAILVCGPLAIAFGYPLGLFIMEKAGGAAEQTWFYVFGGVWLVFFFAVNVMRLLADRVASRVRMKFVPPLEMASGPLVGLLVAVMFTSFFTFTLYSIPIRAGEWPFANASGWQQTTMKTGSGPFFRVLTAMGGQELADKSMGK